MNAYHIKTPLYEGPLDVLLELIESRKLFINELSLASIADDFIAHAQNHQDFPLEQSSEFIVIAATLLLIKSRSLLPSLTLTTEEESSIKELEDRLARYARVKHYAALLKPHWDQSYLFSRIYIPDTSPRFTPDTTITLTTISQTLTDLLSRLKHTEKIPETSIKKVISIEQAIQGLLERVKKNISLRFNEFAGKGSKEKRHIIVSFLAMLELVKQGAIMAQQDTHGGDIEMRSESLDTPHYG